MAKDSKEAPVKKTPEELEAEKEYRRLNPDIPTDLPEYKGQYKYLPTGEVFGLKVLPEEEVRARRTHLAKNATKFWDGTAEEFRAQFDKV